MRKRKWILMIIATLVFAYAIASYFYNRAEENKYIEQCSQRDSIDNISIDLVGFDSKEARRIDVFEKQSGAIIDNFWVTSNWYLFNEDTLPKIFTINIRNPLKIKNSYLFLFNKRDTFVLSDLTMAIIWHHSMIDKSPFCELGHYKVNGQLHTGYRLTFYKQEKK